MYSVNITVQKSWVTPDLFIFLLFCIQVDTLSSDFLKLF